METKRRRNRRPDYDAALAACDVPSIDLRERGYQRLRLSGSFDVLRRSVAEDSRDLVARFKIAQAADSRSQLMKARWRDAQDRAVLLAHKSDPEYRRKMSESAKARWADPAFRARMVQSNQT